MRSALGSLYLAALLSFGAGLLRDAILVRQVDNYVAIFGAMYAVNVAAGFAVNAVTLGAGYERGARRLWALTSLSALLFLLLAGLWKPIGASLLWWCLPVPLLYVVGARASRRLVDRGQVLVGRLRDGLSSLVMALLLLLGTETPAFALSVFAGTAAIVLAHRHLHGGDVAAASSVRAFRWSDHLSTIVFANLATVLINVWAMHANGLAGEVFGVPAAVAVRIALYAFQVLSLPSVLVSRMPMPKSSPMIARLIAVLAAGGTLAAMALPLGPALIAVPLMALVTLYAAVAAMHLNPAS